MYRKGPQGWLKHLDFTVLNLIALHASYCMAYFIRMGTENPYHSKLYRTIAVLLTLFQLLVTIVCHIYKGVLQRGRFRSNRIREAVCTGCTSGSICSVHDEDGCGLFQKGYGFVWHDLSGYGLCGYTSLEGIYTKTSCGKEIYCDRDSQRISECVTCRNGYRIL